MKIKISTHQESISLGWNGDISTITSPAFEQERCLSPIASGSLFGRLARTRQQLLVEESVHKHPGQESTLLIGSPTESATRSTMKIELDSIMHCRS
jgi:hypothetical protein